MNILLSNDDGYLAPGINILASHLAVLGNVTVVAPDRNRSGASNSLTLMRPVTVNRVRSNVFAVEGTPVDCIQVAFGGLMEVTPDIVISGINDGPNLGCDTLYSGTVAAAMEARFLNYSPIAVSMAGHRPEHFETAAQIVVNLVNGLQKTAMPGSTVLNVNVPDVPFDQLNGVKTTRLGSRHVAVPAAPHKNPRHNEMYWLGAAGEVDDESPGTDFYAVQQGDVSITPLQTDLTHHSMMTSIQQWCDDINPGNEP